MDSTIGLIIIAAIYLWLFLMDRFFKSCMHYGYIQFLKGTGLEIKFFRFTWTTTALNKTVSEWANKHLKFYNMWFNVGLCVSLLSLPVSLIFILYTFFKNFAPATTQEPIVEFVVLGVNLPASEIGYYSITLLLSSILHELGHALAAVQEDVPLLNMGAFAIFILPVAYVNVNNDKLFSLNPWKRLKILCAGVWHNVVLALIALLVFSLLPTLFAPIYDYGRGIIIRQINQKSALTGDRGLELGNIIVKINDCDVLTEETWYECLNTLKFKKPAFCIEGDIIHNLDESVHLKHVENGVVSCCHSDNKGKLCFEYLDLKDNILELPPYACLPGRSVIESSKQFCELNPHNCPKDTFCFRPVLLNNTNLFRLKRLKGNDVIYIGPIFDFYRHIMISSYIPKYTFVTTQIPDVATNALAYIIKFSLGLALINIIPCVFMDGQHIMDTLLHIALANRLRTTHIKVISGVVTVTFTIVLIIHFLIAICNRFY